MTPTLMTEPEILQVLQTHLDAEARHDAQAAAATYAEEGYYQNIPLDIRWNGRDAVALQYEASFRGVPNSVANNEGLVLQGNRLVQWGIFCGAMTGSWFGQAPTGKNIALPFIATYEFGNGKMLGETLYYDLATLCDQAGLDIRAVRAAVQVARDNILGRHAHKSGAA